MTSGNSACGVVRVVRVDPAARSLTDVEVDGSLAAYQALVGGRIGFLAVHERLDVWGVDDYHRLSPPFAYWALRDWDLGVFVGPGYIAGRHGTTTVSSPLRAQALRDVVVWLDEAEARRRWHRRHERAVARGKAREADGIHTVLIPAPFPSDMA